MNVEIIPATTYDAEALAAIQRMAFKRLFIWFVRGHTSAAYKPSEQLLHYPLRARLSLYLSSNGASFTKA
jgi:hypothetical protein